MKKIKLSHLVSVCLLLGILLLQSACHHSEVPPPEAGPTLKPDGKYCLTRFNKSVDGSMLFTDAAAVSYNCDEGEFTRAELELELRIFHLQECDESVPPFPPSGNVLAAKGIAFYGADGLAQFTGDFQILHVPSAPEGLLFEGTIELMARIGTHQAFHEGEVGETCDADRHFEGWIMGRGIGDLDNYLIRASLMLDRTTNLPEVGTITSASRMTGMLLEEIP